MKRVSGILSVEEEAELAEVPTSVDDAWRVLRRNAGILQRAAAGEVEVLVHVPCPHCKRAADRYPDSGLVYNCRKCEWTRDEGEVSSYAPAAACCAQTFGGYGYDDVSTFLCLYVRAAQLVAIPLDEDHRHALRQYCLGHIEWAQNLLEEAGISFAGEPELADFPETAEDDDE